MSDSLFSAPAYSKICERAVRILASRDHSEQELRRKLKVNPLNNRDDAPSAAQLDENIDKAIAWCYEQNWLDDHKFAMAYIAGRSRRGYGPLYIRQALQQKGVAREVSEQAFGDSAIEWCEIAKDVALRKFGTPLPESWQKRVKVQRFLLSRGFFMEDIQQIY